jgi:hypothetical protein
MQQALLVMLPRLRPTAATAVAAGVVVAACGARLPPLQESLLEAARCLGLIIGTIQQARLIMLLTVTSFLVPGFILCCQALVPALDLLCCKAVLGGTLCSAGLPKAAALLLMLLPELLQPLRLPSSSLGWCVAALGVQAAAAASAASAGWACVGTAWGAAD